jgi:hypothetical protein
VAGSSARIKVRRLGITDEAQEAEERNAQAAGLNPDVQTVRLLGRDIPVLPAADGTLRAADGGKSTSARRVQTYVARAFGDRLPEVRAEMEALAVTLLPEELNRIGFRLYEHFRPDVPRGAEGWGVKGVLHVDPALLRDRPRSDGRRRPAGAWSRLRLVTWSEQEIPARFRCRPRIESARPGG